ncbi:MAG TPA: hypothetical protein VM261_11780, partial [Kofleriaceae bacterium]|nr:hypothetical protein [Kofleriaceae bacterium]
DRVTALVAHPLNTSFFATVSFTAVGGETMTFGGSPITGAGGTGAEIVVASVTTQNSVLWARRYGTSGSEVANNVAVRPDATIVVSGGYGTNITFGSTTLANAGGSDAFVVRLLQSDGSATFANRVSSAGNDTLGPIASTSSAVVVAGDFNTQTSVFGTTITPVGAADGVIAATILPP